jgi:hypothetical protein
MCCSEFATNDIGPDRQQLVCGVLVASGYIPWVCVCSAVALGIAAASSTWLKAARGVPVAVVGALLMAASTMQQSALSAWVFSILGTALPMHLKLKCRMCVCMFVLLLKPTFLDVVAGCWYCWGC